jgi:hypothetical protein
VAEPTGLEAVPQTPYSGQQPRLLALSLGKTLDLQATNKLLESGRDPQHDKHADKGYELRLRFAKQCDECRRLFAKDLSLV